MPLSKLSAVLKPSSSTPPFLRHSSPLPSLPFPFSSSFSLVQLVGAGFFGFLFKRHTSGWGLSLAYLGRHAPLGRTQMTPIYATTTLCRDGDGACKLKHPTRCMWISHAEPSGRHWQFLRLLWRATLSRTGQYCPSFLAMDLIQQPPHAPPTTNRSCLDLASVLSS